MLQNTTSWFSSWWRNSKVFFGKTTELVCKWWSLREQQIFSSAGWWAWSGRLGRDSLSTLTAIAMIACNTYRLNYSLACFALQKAHFVHYVFTVVTTIAYLPRKKWLTGGYQRRYDIGWPMSYSRIGLQHDRMPRPHLLEEVWPRVIISFTEELWVYGERREYTEAQHQNLLS